VLKEAWAGHVVALLAIPFSFAPTYLSAWQDYRREQTSSWMWWTLGDLCALGYVLLRLKSAHEIPYATIEALCHAFVWYLLLTGRLNTDRRERDEPTAWLQNRSGAVRVGENHLGKAVFAARPFEAGALIMKFGGTPTSGAALPKSYLGAADRYMQVDHDLYLGPSGDADDFVNHSCSPNAGIRFASYGVFLVALQPIAGGEEICWDYSTTMHQNDWVMRCECRQRACRAYVGEFLALPKERRSYYLAAGVVAPYIVKWIEEHAGSAVPRLEGGSVADLQASVAAFASSYGEQPSSADANRMKSKPLLAPKAGRAGR
jgi:hypothetical protein